MKQFIKMIKMKETQAFQQYQLSESRKSIRFFAGVMGFFNLLLLIPDIFIIQSQSAEIAIILMRTILAIVVIGFFVVSAYIKDFKKITLGVSLCEVLSTVVFCVVFCLYERPDFLIQLIGLFIMVLAFFAIPNRWIYKMIVSLIAVIGFVACSFFAFETVSRMQWMASSVYLFLEIILCASASWHHYRFQYSEFISKAELKRIYATDPLTQVGNRVRLEDEAEKWIEFCNRYELNLSLVLIDVDNLKQINDQYGHLIGDVILYELAQIMHTQLRKNDVCTRWGGDEFVILLPSASEEEALDIAERIRCAIVEHNYNIDIPITCSFGVTRMQRGDDLLQLIKQADESMYTAKERGKNTIATDIRLSL